MEKGGAGAGAGAGVSAATAGGPTHQLFTADVKPEDYSDSDLAALRVALEGSLALSHSRRVFSQELGTRKILGIPN